MNTARTTLMIWLALGASLPVVALAHEGLPGTAGDLHARATPDGNELEASAIVVGKVADLKGALYRVESWPELFTDARAVTRKPDGTWAADFGRFGHPHDFKITRTSTGVRFDLADASHGAGRLEYALQPVDATRSKLTVRFLVGTPPQLTPQQMLALLRAKAERDLEDFGRYASILATISTTISTP